MVRVERVRRLTSGAAVVAVMTGTGLVVMSPAPAQAASIVVTTTDDEVPGSLRDALAEAQASPADDTITFDPSATGTILLTGGQLEAAVGGSSGSLTIEGPGQDVLTVDAGAQSRVLDVHGPGGDARPTLVVSGLTLTGGAVSEYGVAQGGALRATGTDLGLERVVISDNHAQENGGGVSLEGGSLLVTASMITGNSSSMEVWGSDGRVPGGGGIFFDGGQLAGAELSVIDSTISDNWAFSQGGGIHSQGTSPMTITRSAVTDNTAHYTWYGMELTGTVGSGGGISAHLLSVVDSTVTGNWAGAVGGGLDARSLEVAGSTIARNVARTGGGVHVDATYAGPTAKVRLHSSTLAGNRADYGGGLLVRGDVPTEVTLTTIADNTAPGGGGVHAAAGVALRESIVAMNPGGDLAGGGSATLTRSLVEDIRGFSYVDNGGSILGVDPVLGPLADHGGATETMLPASNSPVIDQGSAFDETTDQRGSPRPVDDADTPDVVDGSDIGAVELTQAELAGLPQVGSTSRPTITGRVRVGETLHTDGGTWEPEDVSLSYQWLRNGIPIPDATSASYTLSTRDYGFTGWQGDSRKRMSIRVTAEAEGHRQGVRASDYTDYVARGALDMTGRPRVVGRTRVGSILRAWPRLGAISPRPTDVKIVWLLDKQRIRRVDDQRRLEILPRMRGKRVTVRFVYRPPRAYERLSVTVVKRRRVR